MDRSGGTREEPVEGGERRPNEKHSNRCRVSAAQLTAATVTVVLAGLLSLPAFAASSGTVHRQPPPTQAPSVAVAAFDTTATISGTAWFRSMYKRGFRLYVMHSTAWGSCLPWSQTQAQLGAALSVGLKIAVYTRDPRCFEGGIQAAGPYLSHLQFFALDVETDPGIAVTRAMVNGITALGVRPVIYTGSGMWSEVQGGNTASFADVPLWDTAVSGNVDLSTWTPNLAAPAPVAYGGWNTPANPRVMVQQAFNVSVNGVAVDLDSVSAAFLTR